MKKSRCLLLFFLLLLTGCEKNLHESVPASVFELTDGVTAAGVSVGDGKDDFIDAYSEYTIQAAYSDTASSYLVMSIRDIPYDENISTLIAGFFVDGKPVSEQTLCEENQIESSELPDLLSSPEYLRAHEVLYRYLRFTWEDSVITDIDSDELNYNETYEIPKTE